MFNRNNLILSFVLCLSIALTAQNGQALIIDDFEDTKAQTSLSTKNNVMESWGVTPLDNVIGGCRHAEMSCIDGVACVSAENEVTGNFDNISGNYAHNQNLGVRGKTEITWGECEDGSTMDVVDLTLDGSTYLAVTKVGDVNPGGKLCLAVSDSDRTGGGPLCKTTDATTGIYKFYFTEFNDTVPNYPNFKKVAKITLTIDGINTSNFIFGINGVKTGADSPITVCDVIPTASNSYGAKDECGYCPGDTDYGKGKDECGFCPNSTLPENYNYDDGKICSSVCVNSVCGWCPTVSNPGKAGGYTCTQCDDGMDNDGNSDIDCLDPQCVINGTCDPTHDSEATQCNDKSDNDNDGFTDCDDPACLDETGTCDHDRDDEADDPECNDGIDNDKDGNIDAKDSGCLDDNGNWDPADDSELNTTPECNDGKDNDGDGLTDFPDDPGCSSADDNSEDTNPECSDGIDNDGDVLIDKADPQCWVTNALGVLVYNPDGLSEAGCTESTSISDLNVNNERLAEVGRIAALYLNRFYRNSSAEYKRTTLSAKRAATAIKKEIAEVTSSLTSFDIACTSAQNCRNNQDSELNAFSKKVNKLNQIVRRAQRRGLFFKKNYEKLAITNKKQNREGYKTAKTKMLNNRKATTRSKVYTSLTSTVSYIKGLSVCS